MNRVPARRVELLYAKRALFFSKHHGRSAKRLFKAALSLADLVKVQAWLVLLPSRPERARAEASQHWHMVRKALTL